MSALATNKSGLWLQIPAYILIVGPLGYLAVKQPSMEGKLASLKTQMGAAKERIDSIARELPSIGIRVAAEELSKPIRTAVVSTKPFEKSDGGYVALVHIIDSERAQKTTYVAALTDARDRTAAYFVLGVGRDLELHATSGSELTEWASKAGKPIHFPHFVDASSTLVFRNTAADVIKQRLSRLGPSTEKQLEESPADWQSLIGRIKDSPEEFRGGN